MKPARLPLLADLPSLVATMSAQSTHSRRAQSMLSNALSAVWPNLNQPEEPRTTNFNYNGLAAQTAGNKFLSLTVVPGAFCDTAEPWGAERLEITPPAVGDVALVGFLMGGSF